jgi:ribosomal protein S18 acetylase RimI-like enzyme
MEICSNLVYIVPLGVHENHQEQGYGQLLLDEFIVNNKKRFSYMKLHARSHNSGAFHIYTKFGFLKTDTIDGYYSTDDGMNVMNERTGEEIRRNPALGICFGQFC